MALDKETAMKSKSLTSSTAFVTGAKFTITGYNYDCTENGTYYPVFITNIGNLSVKKLLRTIAIVPYTDEGGKVVTTFTPSGTLHTRVRELCAANRGKTNDEVLPILVEDLKNRPLVVRILAMPTIEGQYGKVPSGIPCIDFA